MNSSPRFDTVLMGDAFLIGYVFPDPKQVYQMNIRYSGGGVLLIDEVMRGLGATPKIITAPTGKDGFPLRLIHQLRPLEREGSPIAYQMAERVDVPSTQSVDDEHARTTPLDLKKRLPNSIRRFRCKVFVERITDIRTEAPPPVKCTCDFYVRVASPVIKEMSNDVFARELPQEIVVKQAVCVIVTAAQISALLHVQLQSSIEAITVDLLRWVKEEESVYRLLGFDAGGGKGFERFRKKYEAAAKPLYVIFRLPGGALLLYRREILSGGRESAWIIYDPEKPAHTRNIGRGRVRGTGAMVAGCIAGHLAGIKSDAPEAFCKAARFALAMTNSYVKGGITFGKRTGLSGCFKAVATKARARIRDVELMELGISEVRSFETLWSISKEYLSKAARKKPAWRTHWKEEDAFSHACAAAVALLSHQDGKEIWKKLPLIRFKDLTLIDREEVEDYLALQNILLNYVESRVNKPLNLAVFGPPGSGKSFGTKQLLVHIGNGSKKFQERPCEFNMAQFRGVQDLAEALHVVRNEGLGDSIPVAFFDEFDCRFEDQPYGWLKYLLAPMQEAQFWDNNQSYKLGRCVLVFAGGGNRRFDELNGRLRDPQFATAKGPDFISRLRGVLNIRGVNMPEHENDAGRYILRRAVLLKGMIERIHREAKAPCPDILMDGGLAQAFIGVDGFKHGNRSMEALLGMSHIRPGRTLFASDLPPWEQLEMHVNARQFLDFVNEPTSEFIKRMEDRALGVMNNQPVDPAA